MDDYKIPFHRSLLGRELILGVPPIVFFILTFFTIVVVADFGFYGFIIPYIILLYICKEITKHDEWLLDIVLNSLLEPDELY